jgi:peptidoglycan/LPS O-acetylase OafA/YrhL
VLIAVLLSIHNERVHSFQSIQNITAIDPIYLIIITLSVIVPIIIILLSTSSRVNLMKLTKLKNIFVFLGGISYPIYLLHSRIAIELVNAGVVGKNLTAMLTMVFAIFAIATIVYKIELKIRIFIKQKLYNKFYPKLSTASVF